jgi:hypothetical protein
VNDLPDTIEPIKPLTDVEALAWALGDHRSPEQIAKDGARVTISLIDKLRRQLDQAERACQHVQATGHARKDDDAIWRRVSRAAHKLLDGMA